MLTELRVRRAAGPLTDRWRPLGLEPQAALSRLLEYPFQVLRVAAYWNRLEPASGRFETGELDRLLDAAQRAGQQIIVGLGAVKNFGYPEFFVPAHHLDRPLPEGTLVTPRTHRRLLDAATAFLTAVVARYAGREAIIAWQVEHEAVDPLGVEHSWRLSEAFVRAEVAAVRAADPARPVLMNGFLPTSTPVALQQRWRTRDQGDSLAVAQRLADIVGVDYYPRHALAGAGPLTLYLDGSQTRRRRQQHRRLLEQVAAAGGRLMFAEGQAEPWEAVTTPPSPAGRAMYSCRPEDVITNYRQCLELASEARTVPESYLFWGAEYWLARDGQGDPSYLRAFARVLDESG